MEIVYIPTDNVRVLLVHNHNSLIMLNALLHNSFNVFLFWRAQSLNTDEDYFNEDFNEGENSKRFCVTDSFVKIVATIA